MCLLHAGAVITLSLCPNTHSPSSSGSQGPTLVRARVSAEAVAELRTSHCPRHDSRFSRKFPFLALLPSCSIISRVWSGPLATTPPVARPCSPHLAFHPVNISSACACRGRREGSQTIFLLRASDRKQQETSSLALTVANVCSTHGPRGRTFSTSEKLMMTFVTREVFHAEARVRVLAALCTMWEQRWDSHLQVHKCYLLVPRHECLNLRFSGENRLKKTEATRPIKGKTC